MKTLGQVILDMGKVAVQASNDPSRLYTQQCWVEHIEQLVGDWAILNDKVNKLQANLTANTLSGKNLSGRIRQLFSEADILKYENILPGHLQILSLCAPCSQDIAIMTYFLSFS